MYKIIGADQKEYGPISAEQMRQWITEGRINAQTQAQAVGETTWKPVSMIPEFAARFAAAPPPLSPMGVPMAGADARTRALQDVQWPGHRSHDYRRLGCSGLVGRYCHECSRRQHEQHAKL